MFVFWFMFFVGLLFKPIWGLAQLCSLVPKRFRNKLRMWKLCQILHLRLPSQWCHRFLFGLWNFSCFKTKSILHMFNQYVLFKEILRTGWAPQHPRSTSTLMRTRWLSWSKLSPTSSRPWKNHGLKVFWVLWQGVGARRGKMLKMASLLQHDLHQNLLLYLQAYYIPSRRLRPCSISPSQQRLPRLCRSKRLPLCRSKRLPLCRSKRLPLCRSRKWLHLPLSRSKRWPSRFRLHRRKLLPLRHQLVPQLWNHAAPPPAAPADITINSSTHRQAHARLSRRMAGLAEGECPNMSKLWNGSRKDQTDQTSKKNKTCSNKKIFALYFVFTIGHSDRTSRNCSATGSHKAKTWQQWKAPSPSAAPKKVRLREDVNFWRSSKWKSADFLSTLVVILSFFLLSPKINKN